MVMIMMVMIMMDIMKMVSNNHYILLQLIKGCNKNDEYFNGYDRHNNHWKQYN